MLWRRNDIGYCNDVVLTATSEHMDKIYDLAVEISPYKVEMEDDDFFIISWFGIKWYDHSLFKPIQELLIYLDNIPDEEYGMIVMGDEFEDVREYGSPTEMGIYVERRIVW